MKRTAAATAAVVAAASASAPALAAAAGRKQVGVLLHLVNHLLRYPQVLDRVAANVDFGNLGEGVAGLRGGASGHK